MGLQFNEVYAHCIKIEDSVIQNNRKKSISKRLLEKNVFEICVFLQKSQRMTALSLL